VHTSWSLAAEITKINYDQANLGYHLQHFLLSILGLLSKPLEYKKANSPSLFIEFNEV